MGGNLTISAIHENKLLKVTAAGAITLANGLPDGFQLAILRYTELVVSVVAQGTLRKASSDPLPNQYALCTAVHLGGNEWLVV